MTLPLVPGYGAQEILAGGGLEPLALFALAPLIGLMRRGSAGRAFWLGLLAGSVYFLVALYWLDSAMTTFGHMPLVMSIPVQLLLTAYLALFWALAFGLSARLWHRHAIPWHWSLPVLWTALAFARNYAVTGFPWAELGSTQVRSLWLAQLASLGGVYLLTFVVVFSNAVVEALWASWHKRIPLPKWGVVCWAAGLGFAAVFALVRLQGDAAPADAQRLRVAVVQGNLDERAGLHGPAGQRWVWSRMLLPSQAAVADGAELIVWPEGTLPQALPNDLHSLAGAVFRQQSELPPHLDLIVGGITTDLAQGRRSLGNSAYLVDGTLQIQARYHKRHLVPFGEYVPLGDWLPYEHFIPEWVTFFASGSSHAPLRAQHAQLGMLICYEAIFPEIAAETVAQGAQILVNITNDSWFGASSAPVQHLALSRLRAIETGRYLLRAANTGISAIVDPQGRILAQLPLGLVAIGQDRLSLRQLPQAQYLVADVALLENRTLYGLTGDLFAWLCVLLAVFWLAKSYRSSAQAPAA